MHVTLAVTDTQRAEVQRLFAGTFNDIAPNAVPRTADDALYRPIVAQVRDGDTLLGAALTCRPQMAAGLAMASQLGHAVGDLDAVSELDLMAVSPAARRRGVGTDLVRYLERSLRHRGTKVWFGNATADLEVTGLREFYGRHGFTVLQHGEPLPPFFGREWTPPGAEQPAFFFYKRLKPVRR
ncbi:GNAT family N-acetyltransferase [Cellulosimicrobium sp. TH-20]|uniref:GNAT family N-acetyltransferase n=1 Tax=Cellulosimicrobium sp. TH-20 TaxID=1980001 RepID=UPI0015816630